MEGRGVHLELTAPGRKHSPTICHGLIQATLEKGEAPEHLQYIDDIIVWGDTAEEVSKKGEKIIHLLGVRFAIKKSMVKGPAKEIQFLELVKWQDGHHQIPTEVINKIIAMAPPTNKKETQAFLGAIGFWRMHIPEYSQIASPLYLVTCKKNDFQWGPEQQQAFKQIKQEIGPVGTEPNVKNVLYSAAGDNGPSWNLWQKCAQIGNSNLPGILDIITNWTLCGNFSLADEEEEEQVDWAEEAPPYNQLPEGETRYALFTYSSCCILGKNWKWKATVWSPTRQVAEATEGEGESCQFAELKAVQLALDIAEQEK
ncbi:hypothetical protein BTVI_63416 [Pitangus sulphuratus]|nr:hypothetical protein BTVI_63416 [Pitangus sulphuratus]